MKIQTAFLTLLLSLLTVQSAAAAVVSRKDLEAIQMQVEQKSVEHKRLQAQAAKISVEMATVSKQMVQKARQIQNTEDRISAMEKQLARLQKELKTAEDDFIKEDENLIQTLYALQNLALKPTEALFVQPLTPVEIIRSAMLLRETVPFLAEEAAQIREKLDNIATKKSKIEQQVKKISSNKLALEKEHRQMKQLIRKKAKIRSQIEDKSAAARQKINQLAAQAKDIKELLVKLEKERKAREKLERERQEKLKREREELERYRAEQEALAVNERREKERQEQAKSDDLIKSQTAYIKDVGQNFVKAKGKLSMPARGPIVAAYGQETAKGVSAKGISIKTRSEAQVVSPFDGTVIFAGPFRGYGNIIIIEHGEHYMSLLAGLNSIDCEVGQMLLAGEPIGQMPKSAEAKLYVELRKDSRPIDPEAWFAK